MDSLRTFSFGGGRQSTAALVLAASPELAALYQAGYYDALHAIGVACGLNPQEMRLPDPDLRQQRAR